MLPNDHDLFVELLKRQPRTPESMAVTAGVMLSAYIEALSVAMQLPGLRQSDKNAVSSKLIAQAHNELAVLRTKYEQE